MGYNYYQIDLINFSNACKIEDYYLIEKLMKNRFDINDHIIPICASYWPGWTILHMAARFGKIKLIKCLLEQGADSSIKNKNGEIPLHVFLIHRKKYDIEFDDAITIIGLLSGKRGKNFIIQNNSGKNALDIEFERCNQVPVLLREGQFYKDRILEYILTEMNSYEYYTYGLNILHFECSKDNVNSFENLVSNEKYVNQLIAKKSHVWPGLRPLHIAILHDNVVVINWLLDHGASITAQDIYGNTPLHTFFQEKKQFNEYVLRLFDFDNCKAYKGLSHFHIACYLCPKTIDIVRRYLKEGQHPNSRSIMGETPLCIGVQMKCTELVTLLIMHGAEVSHFKLAFKFNELYNPDAKKVDNLEMWRIILEASTNVTDIFQLCNIRPMGQEKSKKFCEMYKEYYCKLKALGVDLEDKFSTTKRAILHNGYENFEPEDYVIANFSHKESFLENCKKELEVLSKENLKDLLYDNNYRYTRLVLNDQLEKQITDENFKKRFPIYYSVLQYQFGKAFQRRLLINETKVAFHSIFKNFNLPDLCVEEILRNLSNTDLINVMKIKQNILTKEVKVSLVKLDLKRADCPHYCAKQKRQCKHRI